MRQPCTDSTGRVGVPAGANPSVQVSDVNPCPCDDVHRTTERSAAPGSGTMNVAALRRHGVPHGKPCVGAQRIRAAVGCEWIARPVWA
jgi:hypothetical protein